MRAVSRSSKKFHIIAAKTVGVAEKNIINQDNGILDIHKSAVYCGNGDKDSKILTSSLRGKLFMYWDMTTRKNGSWFSVDSMDVSILMRSTQLTLSLYVSCPHVMII